jgi:protein TonB
MNTRFLIPSVTALSLHAIAFLAFPHSPPRRGPITGALPDHLAFLLPPDPPEPTADGGVSGAGSPDVIRSFEDLTPPRESAFEVPVVERVVPRVTSVVLSPGPIGDPEGIGAIAIPGVIVTSAGLDNPPRTRVQVAPAYPFEAKKDGLPGEVLVEFTVDESGQVLNARVMRSTNSVFDAPTLRAVQKWRFEPGRKNGRIVRFRMAQPVTFALNE